MIQLQPRTYLLAAIKSLRTHPLPRGGPDFISRVDDETRNLKLETRNSKLETPTLKPLADKVVMITGASSGIGRGLAVELARRGAKIGLVARRAEVIEEVVGEVEAAGSKRSHCPMTFRMRFHVSSRGEVERRELGPVKMMRMQASGPRVMPDISDEEIASVINRSPRRSNSAAAVILKWLGVGRAGSVISSLARIAVAKVGGLLRSRRSISVFESRRLICVAWDCVTNSSVLSRRLRRGRAAQMPFLMEWTMR